MKTNGVLMKKVIVSVKGKGGLDDEGRMELITEGKLYKKENIFYVSYKETGVTGMEGTTTTLKIEENRVTLIRHGTVSSTFVFEEGRKNTSHYATEFGVFTVEVAAEKVFSAIDEDGGMVAVSYSLDVFGKEVNEFIMTVREVGNDGHNTENQ